MINITVIGGGNGAHVVAGYIGAMGGYRVSMLNILKKENERFGNDIIVKHKDGRPDAIGSIHKVSHDACDVIPESDLLIMVLPAFLHETYFKLIAPFLKENVEIGVLAGHPGSDLCIMDVIGEDLFSRITFWSTGTLPWACRIVEYGKSVQVLSTKKHCYLACIPNSKIGSICTTVNELIGNYPFVQLYSSSSATPAAATTTSTTTTTTTSMITTTTTGNRVLLVPPPAAACKIPAMKPSSFMQFTITGESLHPCILYGNFHTWDKRTPYKDIPLFYQGVDSFTCDVITSVTDEIQIIKQAVKEEFPFILLDGVIPTFDWIRDTYKGQIKDDSTLQTCLLTNPGYDGLTHKMIQVCGDLISTTTTTTTTTSPNSKNTEDSTIKGYIPDVTYRYFAEDFPLGIVVTRGVGELMNVPTPNIDKVILWGQEMMGKQYLIDGKLMGKDITESRAPQRYGITDFKALCNRWYK